MHRHGYKVRKFGRETDQRTALIKSLAESLIIHESIETTLPKAKELLPYVEKLITKAKIGDLHNRRLVISGLLTVDSAHKLVDEIAPMLKDRTSGHLRIERTVLRRGDNAQLARISFVDELTVRTTADLKKVTEKLSDNKSSDNKPKAKDSDKRKEEAK